MKALHLYGDGSFLIVLVPTSGFGYCHHLSFFFFLQTPKNRLNVGEIKVTLGSNRRCEISDQHQFPINNDNYANQSRHHTPVQSPVPILQMKSLRHQRLTARTEPCRNSVSTTALNLPLLKPLGNRVLSSSSKKRNLLLASQEIGTDEQQNKRSHIVLNLQNLSVLVETLLYFLGWSYFSV